MDVPHEMLPYQSIEIWDILYGTISNNTDFHSLPGNDPAISVVSVEIGQREDGPVSRPFFEV